MDIIRHPNPMGQITLPKEYLNKLGLSHEDYFRIHLKDNTIVLTPLSIEPKFTKKELNKLKMLFNDKKIKEKDFHPQKMLLIH